jgi:2-dehydropantoate 2-reductase
VGAARVAVGVTFEGATLLGPGEVRHAGRGPTLVGACPENGLTPQPPLPTADRGRQERGSEADRLAAFADLLCRAGFDARVVTDIEGVLWGKAIVNAAINPLTALWRVPNGELLANADRRALLVGLAKEATAVATARGITLPYPDPVARVEEVCRATAANRSSMLQDVERGRPTEIDSINGVIVAEGRRLGVPTPVNETVWRLVRGLVAG